VHPIAKRSPSRHRLFATLTTTLLLALAAAAQAGAQTAKKVLSVDDYPLWRSIEDRQISGDGQWLAYQLRRPNALDAEPVLHVLQVDSARDREIANGDQPAFSDDSRWVAYFVTQPFAEAKKLREGNRPVTRKAQLLDLRTGATSTWDDIDSFVFAPGSRHLLLRRRAPDPRARHKGVDVVLRDLATGRDQLLGSIADAAFNRNGELLAYTVDAAIPDANGLFLFDLRDDRLLPFDNDTLTYAGLAWNEDGNALAVLKGKQPEKQAERRNVLLAFPDVYTALARGSRAAPVTLDPASSAGFPEGMVVSERRDPGWSADRRLVFFGTKEQRPAPDTTDRRKGTDEVANVDVWRTDDQRIQSVQMRRAEADGDFTWLAAFDVTAGRFVALADSTMRNVDLTLDGRWGIGRDERAFISDWEPAAADLYRVNSATGERTLIAENQPTGRSLTDTSPDGRWFLYWREGRYQLYDLDAGSGKTLAGDTVDFTDTEYDRGGTRPPYGVASWTRDGKGIVLQHRYDLWLVPLAGGKATNLTRGVGTSDEIRFRYISTASTEGMGPLQRARTVALDPAKPVLLAAYGQWTKKSGYWQLRGGTMEPLVFEDAMFGSPTRAGKADRFLFTRETFAEFPDLRIAGPDFADARKVTDANPQQAEYAWGRRILFDFTNSKGVRLQGILAIPDDYQPGEKRPMLVNFYEKNSQNLHRYSAPAYLSSMGSLPVEAVSRGYVALLPDIRFNMGASHSDMLDCIEAATKKVIEMGYADPAHIAIHGHSYGGQGAAFIGTRSRLFAAVGMGAGVTDLTNDFSENWGWSYHYQGGTGANGSQYYINGQGRQATSPWDDPELFRFESARTHVREVTAPFLMMHGTADPTVSFQEGLGFYNAMRFNGKSAILLAYQDEGHSLRGLANRRDLTIRYFQFFDHYLRGTPAPRWMTEGVLFLEKEMRRDPNGQ
jgi:esterase/lipase